MLTISPEYKKNKYDLGLNYCKIDINIFEVGFYLLRLNNDYLSFPVFLIIAARLSGG